MYEQLLEDKQQQIDRVTAEHDALRLEKKQLSTLLKEAHRKFDNFDLQQESEASPVKVKAGISISSKTRVLTPSSSTGPSTVISSSSKRREHLL